MGKEKGDEKSLPIFLEGGEGEPEEDPKT